MPKVEDQIKEIFKKDAIEYGSALNAAGWKFVREYNKINENGISGKLFNNIKPMIRECIIEYIEKLK